MKFEWDDHKEAINREKHGIGFGAIEDAEWDVAMTWPDRRKDYGEERFIGYVPIHGRLHVAVFTERIPIWRLISLRKANARERNQYDQAQIRKTNLH